MFNTLGYKHLLRGTKWGWGGGVGENLLPTDKNRKGTNPLKKKVGMKGGGRVWGGGEDRCPIDITDLQIDKTEYTSTTER